MAFLFMLPDDVSVSVIAVWLDKIATTKLDSATCNVVRRPELLKIFKHTIFTRTSFDKFCGFWKAYVPYMEWVELRGLRLSSLDVDQKDFCDHKFRWKIDISKVNSLTVDFSHSTDQKIKGEDYSMNEQYLLEFIALFPNLTALNYKMWKDPQYMILSKGFCLLVENLNPILLSQLHELSIDVVKPENALQTVRHLTLYCQKLRKLTLIFIRFHNKTIETTVEEELIKTIQANPTLADLQFEGIYLSIHFIEMISLCCPQLEYLQFDHDKKESRWNNTIQHPMQVIVNLLINCTKMKLLRELNFVYNMRKGSCLLHDIHASEYLSLFDNIKGFKIIQFSHLKQTIPLETIMAIADNNSQLHTLEFSQCEVLNIIEIMTYCKTLKKLIIINSLTAHTTAEDYIHICQTHKAQKVISLLPTDGITSDKVKLMLDTKTIENFRISRCKTIDFKEIQKYVKTNKIKTYVW